jgi:hypothetical protein
MEDRSGKARKHLLYGCLVFAVIFLVLGLAASWYIFRAAKKITRGIDARPAEYVQLLKEDTFQPPEDGTIKEEDLTRYLEVSERIREQIQAYFASRGEQLDWNDPQLGTKLLPNLYEIRKIQARVLKKHRFSIKKYRWITRQMVIIFGGKNLKQLNMLLKTFGSKEGGIDAIKELDRMPQENLALVAKYEDQIRDALKLWILSL